MAFQGNKFIFDGIPGEQYGLVLANINNANQDAGKIGGVWKVHEDRIARRSVGLDYGVTANDPLSFPITMVAMEDNHYFDRYDVAAVAGWLTGHQSFKQLIILQDDMENVYYRCRITQLEAVEVGMHVVGFKATVTCDGPYAYRATTPQTIESSSDGVNATYFCQSNVNDYFYPVITMANVTGDISISNAADQGRTFSLNGLPSPTVGDSRTITVDCLHQIMTASDGINLYEYWNVETPKYFPRFVRGGNPLTITGACVATIEGDVSWNIGH